MNRENYAWAAGLFCGEGTTSVYMGKGSLMLSVAQGSYDDTQPEVLLRMKGIFEGEVYGPYEVANRRTGLCMWRATGHHHVQWILCCMWPWLSQQKRRQATEALSHTYREIRASRKRYRGHNRRWGSKHFSHDRFKKD